MASLFIDTDNNRVRNLRRSLSSCSYRFDQDKEEERVEWISEAHHVSLLLHMRLSTESQCLINEARASASDTACLKAWLLSVTQHAICVQHVISSKRHQAIMTIYDFIII